MPFFQVSIALLAGLLSVAVSQSIDPNSVPLATRQTWCDSQITQCPLICLQYPDNSMATYSNTCDAATLSYSCVCSNGLTPNASEYSLTLPYYICTQANSDCVDACGNSNACQSSCTQDHPCGAQDPTRVNTSTMTTMSATATGTGGVSGAVCSGFGDDCQAAATTAAGNDGSSAAARLVLNTVEMYGLSVVAIGVFAGFTYFL